MNEISSQPGTAIFPISPLCPVFVKIVCNSGASLVAPLVLFLALIAVDYSAQEKLPSLRQQLDKKLLAQVEQLERDYNVKMVFDLVDFPKQRPGSYLIQGRQSTLQAVTEYLPMFLHEWRLYPPSLVRNTKLKFIVIGGQFKLPDEAS